MRKAVERRLLALVEGMERDGYQVSADAYGTGWHIRFPDDPVPQICGMMRLNLARREDPELDKALLKFLLKHRPAERLDRAA